jgi:hypothetical protein
MNTLLTILAWLILAPLYAGCLVAALLALNSVWVVARNWKSVMSNLNPNGWNGGCSMEYHESPPQYRFKD